MMKKRKSVIFLSILIIGIIVFNFVTIIIGQKKYFDFTYWQRFPALKQTYLDSQYVNKEAPHGWVSDAVVFTYAGGALIRGVNPILIIPDAPPLGKYIIGISALVFNNEHILTAFFAGLSLALLFLISMQVLKNPLFALVSPLLWSFEPLFKDQLQSGPLLDIFQLVFLLTIFYFFNKAGVSKRYYFYYYLLCSVFLGLFIATKFFVSGVIVIAAIITVLALRKQVRHIITFFLCLPVAVSILLLSYSRVFAFGYGVREYIGIQKWIFLYHKSKFILPFSIWPMLLLNKWYVWFGSNPVIPVPQWNITWPILTMLSFATLFQYLVSKVKGNNEIQILLAWIFFYCIAFSIGHMFSRYLVIFIPILYIISIFGIREMWHVVHYKQRNKL